MAMTMHVDIVSAEAEIFSGTAEFVAAPAELGDVGIMPRHNQLLTRLRPGEVRVRPEGKETELFFYVSGGMLEVQPHVVTVLADTAVRARDLDEAAALEAKRRAEESLTDQRTDFEYAQAQAELAEAVAQLRMIEKLRKQTKRG
ncbi:MAG: F0F1 ATP synthase subunit epsilon [Chromatiales bacterium]|jgi:F-type H+-transporting ATPase subunit epsilon